MRQWADNLEGGVGGGGGGGTIKIKNYLGLVGQAPVAPF